jgi:hypothetical protein
VSQLSPPLLCCTAIQGTPRLDQAHVCNTAALPHCICASSTNAWSTPCRAQPQANCVFLLPETRLIPTVRQQAAQMSSATFMGISSICKHTDATCRCAEAGTILTAFCEHQNDQPERTLTADCSGCKKIENEAAPRAAAAQDMGLLSRSRVWLTAARSSTKTRNRCKGKPHRGGGSAVAKQRNPDNQNSHPYAVNNK